MSCVRTVPNRLIDEDNLNPKKKDDLDRVAMALKMEGGPAEFSYDSLGGPNNFSFTSDKQKAVSPIEKEASFQHFPSIRSPG